MALTDSPRPESATAAEPALEASASSHSERKPAMPALTGLRVLLAVDIMLFHFTPPGLGPLRPLVDGAYVFVGFFFLISGFVLAYNYADRPRLAKRRFYLARISRVYPTYLLVLLLSIPLLGEEWKAHPPQDFYLGLVLTPLAISGWSPILATFWNTVGWTVPAELFLYGIFPFLLLLLDRHRRFLRTPGRLVVAILAVWLLGLTPHLWYFLTNPDHLSEPADRFTFAYVLRILKYTPVAYFCTFTSGVLLARLHPLLTLTPLRRSIMALTSMAGLALFLSFAAERVPYILVHGALLLPLFAILLLALTGPSPVAAILGCRPLVLFGETTFALYLLHFNTFGMIHMFHLTERLHVARFDPWISFAAIMLLALGVHRFFEQPARRFVLARFSPRPS